MKEKNKSERIINKLSYVNTRYNPFNEPRDEAENLITDTERLPAELGGEVFALFQWRFSRGELAPNFYVLRKNDDDSQIIMYVDTNQEVLEAGLKEAQVNYEILEKKYLSLYDFCLITIRLGDEKAREEFNIAQRNIARSLPDGGSGIYGITYEYVCDCTWMHIEDYETGEWKTKL